MLLRSGERTPTYRAADIVYLVDKLERGFDRAIYVLGADHHGTSKWYAAIAGELTKMSKRRGDVVFLDDFVDEVGVDAARWFLVNRGPDQTIDIDVDLAAEKSRKNPVYYVQYSHARCAGIFREAGGAEAGGTPPGPLEPEERALIKRLAEFPTIVREATARRGPQWITDYSIRLADDFHRFYDRHRVLGEETQAFRLGLVRATRRVIARSLDLVGVEAPGRM